MNKDTSIFDSISFHTLQVILFLIPVFFIPSASVPFATAKTGLIILGSLILLVVFVVGRIKEGTFAFPPIWVYGSALIFLAIYACAAFFSGNVTLSLFGSGLDQGSLVFIVALVVLFLLAPLIIDSEEKVFSLYLVLLGSFFVVSLYEVLHLAFPGFSLGVFTSSASNMIGGWNDLAVFFGLFVVLSMVTFNKIPLKTLSRTLLYVCFLTSLVFLILINFSSAWIVLGFFSLVSLIYELSFNTGASARRFSIQACGVLLVSVIFIFFGTQLGNAVTNVTHLSQLEVRPSWSATFDIAQTVLKSHPLFGVGPDRFTSAWLLNKPAGINSTPFWSLDFNYGVGFLPSMLVTVGIIGTLGILTFLILFLIKAAQSLFAGVKSSLGSYLLISSFASSIYLWVFALIYVPSTTMLALTFLFSGIFIAVLVTQGIVYKRAFSFIESPVKNFISILVAVLILIGTITLGYTVGTHIVSAIYFGQGSVILSTTGNLDQAETDIDKALSIAPNPLYTRTIADINLARISNLLQSTTTSQSQAAAQFQSYLAAAIQAAERSVALDPTDYQNYLELGKVYGSVVSLKITGAYDAAKTAYNQALALNPDDPAIYYDLANLDIANGDNASAEADIDKALAEKNDYADAIYLLSQIYINENKISEATNAVKAVAELSPTNPGIFFELGLLEYNQKDYADAAQAFNEAITLSPGYANAEYFLGLSDYYLNDSVDAIAQFENLAAANPNNSDVASILANLKAGKAPIAPAVSSSKKSSSLPVAQ